MAVKPRADIAVIGGSGLYEMEGLTRVREVRVATPFGKPSDVLVIGTLAGQQVAFLSRHGRRHRISPSLINYRANIYALKSLGVKRIFSVSAVGSMKEHIEPGHLVLPDQFIDRTTQRAGTFFDQGLVAHVAFSEPICGELAGIVHRAAQEVGAITHAGGTYVCIEGPQFSTKAESNLYRQWGVDVIGMTNIPEAKLAREAEMCYATLALATDYDCWHETEESVTVEAILSIMHANVVQAKKVILKALQYTGNPRTCFCGIALQQAIVTAPEAISASDRRRYQLFLPPQLKKKPKRS
ncbi:S-methyl-5'-thioadenosine phosphorylase [Candidatus Nitronereus thalassa]|uniref:S-methyl-5'-thioadenosine phosphorylase n=1 Tax=Candidatus Nitronereus thalassa TaxID=3020898 RepID=A0ABU3KB64_9BACT|nr:S-methyl-5'-thioadenosine phosphorylase [Candidatus Nitronereus thalassa]MDT7043654.1 S-methyl-5'-thioadenosine phosphorylase [Candidatus Nitronereus thalassa]